MYRSLPSAQTVQTFLTRLDKIVTSVLGKLTQLGFIGVHILCRPTLDKALGLIQREGKDIARHRRKLMDRPSE